MRATASTALANSGDHHIPDSPRLGPSGVGRSPVPPALSRGAVTLLLIGRAPVGLSGSPPPACRLSPEGTGRRPVLGARGWRGGPHPSAGPHVRCAARFPVS